MSATNNFETSLLDLIITNVDGPSSLGGGGLRGSTTAGVFYVSLSTTSPGEAGTQATGETVYTNYVRVSVARDLSSWTVSGNTADNDAAIDFATGGAAGETISSFGLGSSSSGATPLFLYGDLTAVLAVSSGITPSFAAGDLNVTLD